MVNRLQTSSSTEALTAISISVINLFDSSTEPLELDPAYTNLFSGTWQVSPSDPPCSGTFPPAESGRLAYGFKAAFNPSDPVNPTRLNGTFVIRPKQCTNCGNMSQGGQGFAFALVSGGGGAQEAIFESSGSATDDQYSEVFTSLIDPPGSELVYTLVIRCVYCCLFSSVFVCFPFVVLSSFTHTLPHLELCSR